MSEPALVTTKPLEARRLQLAALVFGLSRRKHHDLHSLMDPTDAPSVKASSPETMMYIRDREA